MKEQYQTPEMEIIRFETEDVITTSMKNETEGDWVQTNILGM